VVIDARTSIFPDHFNLTRYESNSLASGASPCRDSLNRDGVTSLGSGKIRIRRYHNEKSGSAGLEWGGVRLW
jgi:hypothetical protein